MQLTLSAARTRMSELVTRVQDPNECVVLTRHGVPVAAVVSMANLKRIWQMEDEEERGEIKHPLNKFPHVVGSPLGRLVRGLNGRMVTRREAALQVRTMQKTRAEERRILEAGGLEVVEGGELASEGAGGPQAKPRRTWRGWRRRSDATGSI